MRFKLASAFILSFLLLSVACTEKGKPFHEHAPGKQRDEKTNENPLATPASQNHSDKTAEWERQFTATAPGQSRLLMLLPIAKNVLSPDRVRDPRSLLERATADELIALNRMVLNLSLSEKQTREYNELAGLYGAVLMLDCGEFRDSCVGLRFAKIATNTEGVLKDFIKQGKAPNRVRASLLALELKSRGVWDAELVQSIASLPAKADLTAQEKSDLKQAESFISALLVQVSGRIQSREEARAFLDSSQVWRLTGETGYKLEDSARLALFTLIGRAGYLRNPSGRPHPDLQRWIDRMKTNPESVFAKQQRLTKQQLFSPEAIGASTILNYDELTFLLDAVYTRSLTAEAGVELVRSLGLSNAQLAKSVENYVRLQFIGALHDSAVMAKAIFTMPVATEILLRHAMDNSPQIRSIWDAFSGSAGSLRSLTISASQNLNENERRKINGLFDSIPRSIKQASVFPHIMVLFYFASKKRFEVYIPLLNRTLESATLVRYLWEGKLSAFLPYSDDRTPVSFYELMHAFDMAVRTNLFDSVGIDTDDFIADTLRRVAQEQKVFTDKTLAEVQLRMQDQGYFRDFKETCKELKEGKPYSRTPYFGELSNSPYYGLLSSLTSTSIASFNTDTTSMSGIDKKVAGLFYPDAAFNEAVESARLDLGTVERMGENMIQSYEGFLTKFRKLSPAAAKERTAKARAQLAAVRAERASIIGQAQKFHKDFGYCYIKLQLNEAKKSDALLGYETEYLRHIHRQIKKLRAPGITDSEKQQIENAIKFEGLPSGFTGNDAIFSNGYRFSSVDLYVRLSQYHMRGLRTDKESLPAISPHLRFTYGSKLDLDNKIIRESKDSFLPFIESEDEFAASGIRAIFQVGNSFLFWERKYSEIKDYFNTMAALYRAEYNMNGRATTISAQEIIEDFQDVFEFLKLTPLRRQLLFQLRRETWQTTSPLMHLNYLFLRVNYEDSGRPFGALTSVWGLYDYLFSLMGNEQFGYNLASREAGLPIVGLPQREVLFNAGRNYYVTRSASYRGNPVLPYNADLDTIMDVNVSRFVRSELSAVNEFNDAVLKKIEEQKKLPVGIRPRVDLTVKMSISDWLSEAVAQDFENRALTFHQQTNNMFK